MVLIAGLALAACGTSQTIALPPNEQAVVRQTFIHQESEVRHAKPSVECAAGPHVLEVCTLRWPKGEVETFVVKREHGGYRAVQQSEGVR